MGFRRQKRLTELPVPEALQQSFERCLKMERGELLVWAEATTLTIDRRLHDYSQTLDLDTIWDVHHHVLQLVGMTMALVDKAGTIEFERPPA